MPVRRTTASVRGAGRSAARGFTLLETLIAAVLIVLAVSLLMTALVQINRIQGRIAELVQRRTDTELGLLWWRELVSGLHPAGAADPDVFRGSARQFNGVSIAGPTAQAPGRAVAFALSIVEEPATRVAVLRYAAAGREVDLLRLPAHGVRFAYLDGDGGIFDEWPPRLSQAPEIPAAVRMTAEFDGRQRMLFAASGGAVRTMPSAGTFFDLKSGLSGSNP
jgi:Tfp pilus assembly protein PilV